jgi:hypothetical protein
MGYWHSDVFSISSPTIFPPVCRVSLQKKIDDLMILWQSSYGLQKMAMTRSSIFMPTFDLFNSCMRKNIQQNHQYTHRTRKNSPNVLNSTMSYSFLNYFSLDINIVFLWKTYKIGMKRWRRMIFDWVKVKVTTNA